MKTKSIGTVLIHGAGLNGTIWNEVVSGMDGPVLTVNLPNRNGGDTINSLLTFEDYLTSIKSQIAQWGIDEFVIVAHSIGGCLALKIAEEYKSKVKGFVAIGSIIPKVGKSFVASFPFPQNWLMPVIFRFLGTKPPAKMLAQELCNDLNTDKAEHVVNSFTPESRDLYCHPIYYSLPTCERLYILLKNDKAIPYPMQQLMTKNLDSCKLVSLESGHLPMLSVPARLSEVLVNFKKSLV